MLAAVEQIVGPEITLNPIQHIRPYIPHRFGGGYGNTTVSSLRNPPLLVGN